MKTLHAGKSKFWQLKQLYVIPSNLRALIAGCGLMAISQLGGFNSLMYYSSTLFGIVGFQNPVAVGTIIAGTNFVFTWVNLMLVDRIGRRRILILTMPVMALFLALAAVCFHWIPVRHDLTLIDTKVGWPANVVLVCMVFTWLSTHLVWETPPGYHLNSSPWKSEPSALWLVQFSPIYYVLESSLFPRCSPVCAGAATSLMLVPS